MVVKLKGEAGKDNPFNPIDLSMSESTNVRKGIFGTAFNEENPSECDIIDIPARKIIRRDPALTSFAHRRDENKPSFRRGKNNSKPNNSNKISPGLTKKSVVDESALDNELDRYMKK